MANKKKDDEWEKTHPGVDAFSKGFARAMGSEQDPEEKKKKKKKASESLMGGSKKRASGVLMGDYED